MIVSGQALFINIARKLCVKMFCFANTVSHFECIFFSFTNGTGDPAVDPNCSNKAEDPRRVITTRRTKPRHSSRGQTTRANNPRRKHAPAPASPLPDDHHIPTAQNLKTSPRIRHVVTLGANYHNINLNIERVRIVTMRLSETSSLIFMRGHV